jgi:hypothetical protein
VMGPDQPGLEVGKNEVDGGKEGFGFIRIAALGDGMVVAYLSGCHIGLLDVVCGHGQR